MEEYQYDFESRHEFIDFVKNTCKQKHLIVKFSAGWCGPCKKIYNYCVEKFNSMDKSMCVCIEVDTDDSFDIFAFLKQKKMVQGIPTIFLYRIGKDNYIPDESVSGTNIDELDHFFKSIQ